MSKQTIKETMQQALDYLQAFPPRAHRMGKSSHVKATNRLVQAIADYEQAEKQEPVGRKLTEAEMGIGFDRKCGTVMWFKAVPEGSNLYTRPAPKYKKPPLVSQEPNSQLYNAARAMVESYVNLVDSEHGNFWTEEREKIHANMVDALKQQPAEPHVNQLMLLSYNIGVANAKSANLDMEKAIKDELKDAIMEYLNE